MPEPDNANDGEVWYIPHFAVAHPRTKKLRVVFDGKASYHGTSFNSHLLQGPEHMNSLFGILCRFRRESIAICCDIQKMFYNFYVKEADRDYLRFLWMEGKKIKKYRMKVHLFGAKSSPAVATYGLRKIAEEHRQLSEKAYNFINKDFYVDDGITSAATVEEAVALINNTRSICEKRNLRLHKTISNSKEVLAQVPEDDRAVKKADLLQESLPCQKTLGMEWSLKEDQFIFLNSLESKKATTRRSILSAIAQIYDPMGFIALFVLTGKSILQDACAAKLEWNEPVGDDLMKRWESWVERLDSLSQIRVDRKLKPDFLGRIVTTELHHFEDASETGYGACSYLRLVDEHQQSHINLLIGKARVVPLKVLTIPRLELQAAVVAA